MQSKGCAPKGADCTKENKCHDLFAFLFYLMQLRLFKEIHVSYCVVGHTHIDIGINVGIDTPEAHHIS